MQPQLTQNRPFWALFLYVFVFFYPQTAAFGTVLLLGTTCNHQCSTPAFSTQKNPFFLSVCFFFCHFLRSRFKPWRIFGVFGSFAPQKRHFFFYIFFSYFFCIFFVFSLYIFLFFFVYFFVYFFVFFCIFFCLFFPPQSRRRLPSLAIFPPPPCRSRAHFRAVFHPKRGL